MNIIRVRSTNAYVLFTLLIAFCFASSCEYSFAATGDEPTAVTWPDNSSAGLLYDAAGRVRQSTDEREIVANYISDNADRLTDIQFPAYPAYNVHVNYDEANRPLSVSDSTGSTTFHYDPVRKRLTSVDTVVGGRLYTVSDTYFPDGTRASMVSPAGTTSYSWSPAGQLTSMTGPFGEQFSWGYDHAGRVTRETAGPAVTTYAWGTSGQSGDPSTRGY